jgi:glucokinase
MAYACGIGLSRMAYEKIDAGVETRLSDFVTSDRRRISGEQIASAARQGDTAAREILAMAGRYGGVGLSMVVQILNPERIVLGGGLTRVGSLLLTPMMAAMREHSQPELWDSVEVVPWQLGDDLGILGAAAQVFSVAEAREL